MTHAGKYDMILPAQRGVAQLVARLLWEQDAAGSNPVTPTMLNVHNGLDRYEHSFLCTLVFRAGFACSFLLCRQGFRYIRNRHTLPCILG